MSGKDSEIAIKVDNVTKHFLLPHQRAGTLKSIFINPFNRANIERQKALDSVSFEVKKGEFFGIVGRNGSGKSTLLKCMAGVYALDKGKIEVNGSLVPFIELGVGFNPELSGRDNVYLNGALLGFSRDEIDAMYDEIVEFAELEKFMDQKLKNYSSGMQVRLAFSIAIRAKGDILLLDEVLAVGDEAFQKKCYKYFEDLKRQKSTVILVTHNMSAVENFCDKALMLDEGKLVKIGDSEEISYTYYKKNTEKKGLIGSEQQFYNENFQIVETVILDDKGNVPKALKPNNRYILKFKIDLKKESKNIGFGFSIKTPGSIPLIGFNSYFDMQEEEREKMAKKGTHIVEVELINKLKNGTYRLDAGLHRDISTDGHYHLRPITVYDGLIDIVSAGWNPPGVKVDHEFNTKVKEI